MIHFLIMVGLILLVLSVLAALFNLAVETVKKTWERRWTERTGRPANELWDTPPHGGWPSDPSNMADAALKLQIQEGKTRYQEARRKDPSLPDWENRPFGGNEVCPGQPQPGDQDYEKWFQAMQVIKAERAALNPPPKKSSPLAVAFAACFCLSVAAFIVWAWVTCNHGILPVGR